MALLPLTINFVITSSNPFFVSIMAFFILREVVSKCEVLSMFLSFGAVLLLALSKPDAKHGELQEDEGIIGVEASGGMNETLKYTVGLIASICSCLFISIMVVSTRKLKDLHYLNLQFYFNTACLFILLVYLIGRTLVT